VYSIVSVLNYNLSVFVIVDEASVALLWFFPQCGGIFHVKSRALLL